jgi:hypothetical protein
MLLCQLALVPSDLCLLSPSLHGSLEDPNRRPTCFYFSRIKCYVAVCCMGKDLSVTIKLYVQGVLNANSRKLIESWKSPLSNAQNPGDAKNSAKPKKPKQTQLRETRDSAEESGPKLDVSAEAKLVFSSFKFSSTLVLFIYYLSKPYFGIFNLENRNCTA